MKVKQLRKILEQYDGNLEVKVRYTVEQIDDYTGYKHTEDYERDLKEENIKLPDDEGDMDLRYAMDLRFYLEAE